MNLIVQYLSYSFTFVDLYKNISVISSSCNSTSKPTLIADFIPRSHV
jgi:hypothetical protein